jgi:hypothetical protein
MRHRDLGKWQEAQLLFESARRRNGDEGERIRFYGRKRFPHYLPRFYVGEALFHLGDYRRRSSWRVYDSGGRYAGVLPDAQRRQIADYRWLYEQRVYQAVRKLAQKMVAAQASLSSLQKRGPSAWSAGASSRRGALRVVPSCPAVAAGPPLDRLQQLRACLDSAETLLNEAGPARTTLASGGEPTAQVAPPTIVGAKRRLAAQRHGAIAASPQGDSGARRASAYRRRPPPLSPRHFLNGTPS